MCNGKMPVDSLLRDADRAQQGPSISAPQRLAEPPLDDSKAAGWDHLKPCSRPRLAFGAGSQLGASVPLHGASPCGCSVKASTQRGGWVRGERSPGREDLVRVVSSSQPTLRSHPASLSAHGIPRVRPKVFPGSRGGNGGILPEHMGPEMLLWLFWNNTICHQDLLAATSADGEGAWDSRL